MFQRDYFMRMISQMTEALGQVMGLRKAMKQEEAILVLEELLDKHFRLSGKLIRSLSDEDLIKMMTTNGLVDTDHLQAIAYLLKQEAVLFDELGREAEGYALYVRSLGLFIRLSLMNAEPTIVEPGVQIAELLELLRAYELPIPAKRLLMEWYDAEGKYDLAENMLYELQKENALSAAEGIALYNRWLQLSDKQLAEGGLPREEVQQGLTEITGAMKE